MEGKDNHETIMIPYAVLEMQEDRYLEEKKELIKHDRKILLAVCAVFLAFIIGVFGTVFYVFHNVEFAEINQDGNGINNILGDNTQQGDLNNGTAAPNNQTEIQSTEMDSN